MVVLAVVGWGLRDGFAVRCAVVRVGRRSVDGICVQGWMRELVVVARITGRVCRDSFGSARAMCGGVSCPCVGGISFRGAVVILAIVVSGCYALGVAEQCHGVEFARVETSGYVKSLVWGKGDGVSIGLRKDMRSLMSPR